VVEGYGGRLRILEDRANEHTGKFGDAITLLLERVTALEDVTAGHIVERRDIMAKDRLEDRRDKAVEELVHSFAIRFPQGVREVQRELAELAIRALAESFGPFYR